MPRAVANESPQRRNDDQSASDNSPAGQPGPSLQSASTATPSAHGTERSAMIPPPSLSNRSDSPRSQDWSEPRYGRACVLALETGPVSVTLPKPKNTGTCTGLPSPAIRRRSSCSSTAFTNAGTDQSPRKSDRRHAPWSSNSTG